MAKSKTLQDRLNDLDKCEKEKAILVSRFLYERVPGTLGMGLALVNQAFINLDRKYLPSYVRVANDFFEDLGFGKVGTNTYRNFLECLQKKSSPQKTY